MRSHVDRVIVPQDRLARRVAELARQITADFSQPPIRAGGLTVIPVMTGAMVFCADLVRQMPIQLRIATVHVSSYPGAATRSQGVKFIGPQLDLVPGHHVLLVDDILDSGNTLKSLKPLVESCGPAVVRVCVLLRKDRPEARATPVDYVGFDVPDEFVVGYGLDYDGYYRNLPDIVSLKPEVISVAAGKGDLQNAL